jgi:hypothetical protein
MVVDRTNWHKRQAQQLASQLPEEPADAWAILSFVEELQEFFWGPRPSGPTPGDGGDQVVAFPGGSKRPNRRANSIGRPSALPK